MKRGLAGSLRLLVIVLFALGGNSVATAKIAKGERTVIQQAKDKTIKVTIKDASGNPIVGAVVMVKGTNNATTSDLNGTASLSTVSGAVLKISFIGLNSQELTIGQGTSYNVVLAEENFSIDEVVVVGFGKQKKANMTGAVSQVNMESVLVNRPVTSVATALQGAVPGLTVTGGSSPGTSKTFNIRGITSISGGEPLVLVDNVPGNIDMINPEDIESVTVLKDAASTAIYGARAAFGVILITTKKAKNNSKLQLTYNNNFGFEQTLNMTARATPKQILQAFLDADFGGGIFFPSGGGQDMTKWMKYLDTYNTNPKDLEASGKFYGQYGDVFVPTGLDPDLPSSRYYVNDNDQHRDMMDKYGFQQNHNVSALGGSEKINYRFSLGYTNNDGILKTNKDAFNRITVSSYVDATITSWLRSSLDIKYAKSRKTYPGDIGTVDGGGLFGSDVQPFTPRGLVPFKGEDLLSSTRENMLLVAPAEVTLNENPRIFSHTVITPVKGLELAFDYTFDGQTYDYKLGTKRLLFLNRSLTLSNANYVPSYTNNKSNTYYNAINTYGTYQFDIKKQHNFKIMAGFSQETRNNYALKASRTDLINQDLPSLSGAIGVLNATDSFDEYIIRGGFYRFNYNFKDKYLFEANGRYDGSSKFPNDNRFGFFPSFSVGWQVAKEGFMKWSSKWLDEFKLRGSWGQIGNQDISNYGFSPSMDTYKANWIQSGAQPISLNAPSMVRSDYTWEVVETLDAGIDMTLLNSRLRGTFDWYQRDTKGMLTKGMDFVAVVGTTAPLQNAADLRTSGFELEMSWRDKIGEVGYNVGFNLYNSNMVITKFDNANKLLSNWYEGQKYGEIWGYSTDRYYTIDDFKPTANGVLGWQNNIWNLKDGITTIKGITPRPGDMKFQNLRDWTGSTNQIDDGEGTVANPGDRKIIGNSQAHYNFGFTAGADWKGIAFSMMLQGVGKRDYYGNTSLDRPFQYDVFGTVYADQLDYWKPVDAANGNWTATNPDASFARIYGGSGNAGTNYRIQTKYLKDASYLRIKNVSLSYSLPTIFVKKIGLTGTKVFCSIENLHTFHHLPQGYDPERLNWGYPFYRTVSFGINVTL